MDRELKGLLEAMNYFDLKNASVITNDQSDTFIFDEKKITAFPFHEWALQSDGNSINHEN